MTSILNPVEDVYTRSPDFTFLSSFLIPSVIYVTNNAVAIVITQSPYFLSHSLQLVIAGNDKGTLAFKLSEAILSEE